MKTQISRDSHAPDKRYSGVYQQQGRMITDADWNELVDILKQRLQQSLSEVVGSGVPRPVEANSASGRRVQGLAIVDDAGILKVRPGAIYVHGVRGELPGDAPMAFNAQPDFPSAPAPGGNARIYVDLWERTEVSLQNPALRDLGLHGADTCARTQTMVQVKCCPTGFDPAVPARNPGIGDATLKVSLLAGTITGDLADPCLTETTESLRIGNYLFRLEVQDAVASNGGNTLTLTLKWSSENGAEHFVLMRNAEDKPSYEGLPPDFTAGAWAYETYNDTSERHLGLHQYTDINWSPTRSLLLTTLDPARDTPDTSARYVRRWDGFCTLILSRTSATDPWTALLDTAADGIDKGASLQTANASSHGYVDTANHKVKMQLEGLSLTLELDNHTFVPGDYWLAVIREAASTAQQVEVLYNGRPVGIRHHYLEIARTDAAGHLVATGDYVEGSAVRRALDFPPLANLTADRIGYDPGSASVPGNARTRWERWTDINEVGGARPPITVQEALDDLVGNLESSDVRYRFQSETDCASTTSYGATRLKKHIFDALIAKYPALASDPATPVKIEDLWNELLCGLDAKRIAYNPTDTADAWRDILDDAEAELPTNLQQALDDLVGNIESSDIAYTVPECTATVGDTPSLKDELGISGTTDIKQVLDTLLCDHNATTLPVEKNPELAVRLNVPGVVTVQDALNLLGNASGGGGLAAVIAALTNGVARSGSDANDDELNIKSVRQLALSQMPVQGDDSLLGVTVGMVLDAVRFVYTVALEFLDVGTLGTVRGNETLGYSSNIDLRVLAAPEGYAALWRRITDKQNELKTTVGNELLKEIVHTIMLVVGQRLIGTSQSTTEEQFNAALDAIARIKAQAGSTESWNGMLLREVLLSELYEPIVGSQRLDHPAVLVLKGLIMEILARVWQRISQKLYLETLPTVPLPTDDQWMSEVSRFFEIVSRAVAGQGLVRRLSPVNGYDYVRDVFIQRDTFSDGYGFSWLLVRREVAGTFQDTVMMRMRHASILEAISNGAVECPQPELIIAPSRTNKWLSFEDARISGDVALIKVQTSSGIVHCAFPAHEMHELEGNLTLWGDIHSGGIFFYDATTGDLVHSVTFPSAVVFGDFGNSRMVDGLTGELQLIGHLSAVNSGSVTLTCSTFRPMFTISGAIPLGTSVTSVTLQGVYNLSLNAPAEGSHMLAVMDMADGQMISLLHGVDKSGAGTSRWMDGVRLEPLRTMRLFATNLRVLGAAHDQVIVKQAQGGRWVFLPVRAMHNSMWGNDGGVLQNIMLVNSAGSEPYDVLGWVNREFEPGEIGDYFAGDGPWIACQPTSNQRYFYRCFSGVFPVLDIVLPGGETKGSGAQTGYAVETNDNQRRMVILRASGDTMEFHVFGFDSELFGKG